MVLFEPERTQFDLSWRMFGIGVRIHPMFWLMACLMGANLLNHPSGQGIGLLFLWVGCLFVSILVHEFGHILMGRLFGAHGHIVLYGFGGLAIGSASLANRWQRIAVSFAGPLAGFILYGFVFLAVQYLFTDIHDGPARFWVKEAARMLILINLFWGLLNLLPIWPLDGGQISYDFFSWAAPRHGVRIALGLSFVLAAALAVHCLLGERGTVLIPFLPRLGWFGGILFALLAKESFMMLQRINDERRRTWHDDDDPWQR